nr:putative uncharacterized protein DDB_G0292292 [Lepeophtheirus salmonis]
MQAFRLAQIVISIKNILATGGGEERQDDDQDSSDRKNSETTKNMDVSLCSEGNSLVIESIEDIENIDIKKITEINILQEEESSEVKIEIANLKLKKDGDDDSNSKLIINITSDDMKNENDDDNDNGTIFVSKKTFRLNESGFRLVEEDIVPRNDKKSKSTVESSSTVQTQNTTTPTSAETTTTTTTPVSTEANSGGPKINSEDSENKSQQPPPITGEVRVPNPEVQETTKDLEVSFDSEEDNNNKKLFIAAGGIQNIDKNFNLTKNTPETTGSSNFEFYLAEDKDQNIKEFKNSDIIEKISITNNPDEKTTIEIDLSQIYIKNDHNIYGYLIGIITKTNDGESESQEMELFLDSEDKYFLTESNVDDIQNIDTSKITEINTTENCLNEEEKQLQLQNCSFETINLESFGNDKSIVKLDSEDTQKFNREEDSEDNVSVSTKVFSLNELADQLTEFDKVEIFVLHENKKFYTTPIHQIPTTHTQTTTTTPTQTTTQKTTPTQTTTKQTLTQTHINEDYAEIILNKYVDKPQPIIVTTPNPQSSSNTVARNMESMSNLPVQEKIEITRDLKVSLDSETQLIVSIRNVLANDDKNDQQGQKNVPSVPTQESPQPVSATEQLQKEQLLQPETTTSPQSATEDPTPAQIPA